MTARRILVVRMGSMGDVIHTLPAVATLKHSLAGCFLAWIVDPRWAVLLRDNPFIDKVIEFDRKNFRDLLALRRRLRAGMFDTVVDFQGLIKSALVSSTARPDRIYGFHQSQLRERLAALFYSHRTLAKAAHVVDRNLELAAAVGASNVLRRSPLPEGKPEGKLPEENFVLAAPLAGWGGKQWPLPYYEELADLLRRKLEMPLVVNGAPGASATLESIRGCLPHCSDIDGLIHATRRATAVVGIDSGPLHLAAALGKSGVAIYGPTDPARNGPYGGTITILRSRSAPTTYKRRPHPEGSMKAISPTEVFEALRHRIENGNSVVGCDN